MIEIKPVEGYVGEENSYPDIGGSVFESSVAVGGHKDNEEENDYTVKLYLKAEPKEEGSYPYSFEIGVQGFFSIEPEAKIKNNRKEFVLINGASMLYGISREMLLSLTSRFEHGAIMIPTVNFLNLKEETPVKND